MAYNFYQNQKQVSFGLQSQISGLQESISNQGKEQLIDRQAQIAQLSQEQDIETTEEKGQLLQLQSAGAGSLIEGSILGIPAVKNVAGLVKTGYNALQQGTEAFENIKSTATEAISTIKQSATKITSNLSNATDKITSTLSNATDKIKQAVLENPLTDAITSSSFESPTNIFQKQFSGVLSDTEKAIQQQTQALNQYRTTATEQFGDAINMTGRQLSDIPTAVLPTTNKPLIQETSFGLETPSKNPIAGNKSAMNADGELSPVTKIEAPIAEVADTVSSTVEKSKGILGSIFGDIGEAVSDIFDPIGDIATAGLAVFGIVKGIEDETAKPESLPTQAQPAPLPQEQIPTEIQSSAQVGI